MAMRIQLTQEVVFLAIGIKQAKCPLCQPTIRALGMLANFHKLFGTVQLVRCLSGAHSAS